MSPDALQARMSTEAPRSRHARLRAELLGMALALATAGPAQADTLTRWLASTRAERYEQPAPAQIAAAEAQFARLLAGAGAATAPEWRRLGFELRHLSLHGETLWSVTDATATGGGAYLFRPGGAGLALQAPHGRSDRRTGAIVLALFAQGNAVAAAWNSAPRRPPGADLAHLPESYHTAFARAFARRYPHGRLVQIHGFDPAKHEAEDGAPTTAVVSDGTIRPGPALTVLADCLRGALGPGLRLYPFERLELGGTTNAVGRTLRALGFAGFVHLELDPASRTTLAREAAPRAALLACLAPREAP
jgi:hypothetical protein